MQKPTQYTELLREAGFRATPGKIALLAVLAQADKPLSIAELARRFRGKLNTVTLYRSLEALVERGIVRRVDLGHAHAHYELAESKRHHHHLVCKICGAVEDILSCEPFELEKQVLKKSKTFASIQSHAMEFFGLCKKCINS